MYRLCYGGGATNYNCPCVGPLYHVVYTSVYEVPPQPLDHMVIIASIQVEFVLIHKRFLAIPGEQLLTLYDHDQTP